MTGLLPSLFALRGSDALGAAMAAAMRWPLAAHEEREFEDGEHKVRPLENVRGRDVYILHTLHATPEQSVNDKLCRLLFLAGAVRDAGAGRITAVAPYLCYARKDRRTQPRDPVTTRYVAALFESVGVGRVVTLDVHNLAAFQNAFRCPAEHLEARPLFVRHLATRLAGRPVTVVSPDIGGVKRAERLRDGLAQALGAEVGMGFMQKRRALGVVSGDALVADVDGHDVVIIDDLISSGGTLRRAADACAAAGATAVYAAATHGLFTGQAAATLAGSALTQLLVTDTVMSPATAALRDSGRLVVLPVAPLLAEAVRRLHTNGSLVELLDV